MGFKNIFKKSSKLFNREGFYIILFVCLCVVAVTAVYMSRVRINDPSKKTAKEPKVIEEPQDSKQSVNNKDTKVSSDNAAPTMKGASQKSTNTSSTTTNTARTKKSDPARETIRLIMPVQGEIAKGYDKNNLQEAKAMNQFETHEGLDIACDLGAEVKAAADGKIVKIFNDDDLSRILRTGMGMTVIIQHNNGIQSVYCNLGEKVNVKVGDSVKKGQVIGVVGDTTIREAAAIEGSHLHFAVFKKQGNEYITANPKDYIK